MQISFKSNNEAGRKGCFLTSLVLVFNNYKGHVANLQADFVKVGNLPPDASHSCQARRLFPIFPRLLRCLKNVIPEKANDPAEDSNILEINRVHRIIFRLEAEAVFFLEEPLAGSLVVIVHSDDNIPVFGG